jgi:hypothetical protein
MVFKELVAILRVLPSSLISRSAGVKDSYLSTHNASPADLGRL